jgi:hypothetical protein
MLYHSIFLINSQSESTIIKDKKESGKCLQQREFTISSHEWIGVEMKTTKT